MILKHRAKCTKIEKNRFDFQLQANITAGEKKQNVQFIKQYFKFCDCGRKKKQTD